MSNVYVKQLTGKHAMQFNILMFRRLWDNRWKKGLRRFFQIGEIGIGDKGSIPIKELGFKTNMRNIKKAGLMPKPKY